MTTTRLLKDKEREGRKGGEGLCSERGGYSNITGPNILTEIDVGGEVSDGTGSFAHHLWVI